MWLKRLIPHLPHCPHCFTVIWINILLKKEKQNPKNTHNPCLQKEIPFIFAKFYVWFEYKTKNLAIMKRQNHTNTHTSLSNDQEKCIVFPILKRNTYHEREMNWLLLALLLLLYYCVSHESFSFFYSCLSLIFILLCVCVC